MLLPLLMVALVSAVEWASKLTPRDMATLLLRLGTLPFVALPVALHFLPPPEHKRIRIAMVCYAGTILAFIGGLQQAAAVSTPSLARTSLISLFAIVTALTAMASILSASVLPRSTPWKPKEIELRVMCAAYIVQIGIERFLIPRLTKHAMLYKERRW